MLLLDVSYIDRYLGCFQFSIICSLCTHSFSFCNAKPSSWSLAGLPHFAIIMHFLLSKASSTGQFLPHPARVGLFPQKEDVELCVLGLRSRGPCCWPTQYCCPWGFRAPESPNVTKSASLCLPCGWLHLISYHSCGNKWDAFPWRTSPLHWRDVCSRASLFPEWHSNVCSCFQGSLTV